MKKLVLTIAIVLGLGLNAIAQNDDHNGGGKKDHNPANTPTVTTTDLCCPPTTAKRATRAAPSAAAWPYCSALAQLTSLARNAKNKEDSPKGETSVMRTVAFSPREPS